MSRKNERISILETTIGFYQRQNERLKRELKEKEEEIDELRKHINVHNIVYIHSNNDNNDICYK